MSIISQLESLENACSGPLQPTEEERQNAINALKLTKTTLNEYLEACHKLFTKALASEPGIASKDPSSTEQGPHLAWSPTALSNWPDFEQQQRAALASIHAAMPPGQRVFENIAFLDGLSGRLSDLGAGDALTKRKMRDAVETPARSILAHLTAQRTPDFMPVGHFFFAAQPETIQSVAATAGQANQSPGQPILVAYTQERNIICGATATGAKPVLVTRYLSPDKIPAAAFHSSLFAVGDFREWLGRDPSRPDDRGWGAVGSRQRVGRVLLEVYRTMVDFKVEYGQVVTGESLVFLKVDWEEPAVLYFHVATPGTDVEEHPDDVLSYTAVGQELAFMLRATGV